MPLETTNPFDGQTPVGDFFAPFFTVRFLSAEVQQGKRVDGETGAETTADIPDSAEIVFSQGNTRIVFSEDDRTNQFRSFSTKLQVTNEGGGPCMVELTMEPPILDAIRIIDNRLIQQNSIMVAEWGWSSDSRQNASVSEKHYFTLFPPKLEMKDTDVTVTITGVDMFLSSSTKRETRTRWLRTTYDTDFKILQAIADKNKMRLNTTLAPPKGVKSADTSKAARDERAAFGNELLPIHQKKPLNDKDPDVVEQNEKDFLFFRRLCEGNRCDFFTIGDTIFIVDRNIARAKQEIAFRLVYYIAPVQSSDIPIINFSTEALGYLFYPAESKEVICKTADEDGQTFKSTAYDPLTMPDNEILGPRTTSGKAEADGRTVKIDQDTQVIPNPAFAENETGKVMSCPSGQVNHEEYTKRIVSDASLLNRAATVTIPGVPALVPMQIVRVDGVGRVFGGPYLVMKVVHRLGTEGYECDLTLIRESSTGDDVAGRGQRPVTGGNDPPQSDGGNGEGVDAVNPDMAPK